MREPNETPMIWTSKGNLPIDILEYRTEWIEDPTKITMVEIYEHRGDVVRRSVHVYDRKGLCISADQVTFG